MKNMVVIIMIIFFQFVCQSCKNGSISVEDDNEFITIAGYTYGEYDGIWYFVSDGKKGDRIILSRLVTKPKLGIDMNNYNYQAAGVPELSVIAVILDDYYVLDTSKISDPFEIAKKLWITENFENICFDAYGERSQ